MITEKNLQEFESRYVDMTFYDVPGCPFDDRRYILELITEIRRLKEELKWVKGVLEMHQSKKYFCDHKQMGDFKLDENVFNVCYGCGEILK